MNKKYYLFTILVLFLLGISLGIFYKKIIRDNNNTNYKGENDMTDLFNKNVKINIYGENYELILEDNDTAKAFFAMLPLNFEMQELNGNEKYYYLDTTLPSNDAIPKQIQKGDVMLYNGNCIVIFYKDFITTYSYTKIGHIVNLPDLSKENITVKIEK